jgi:hypothetical protein
MEKVFKSKIDSFLLVIVFAPIILGGSISIYNYNWVLGMITFLLLFIVINILLNTNYTINDFKLQVKNGLLFNEIIDIQAISKISKSNSWEKAPALSMDRLEIKYNEKPAVRYNFYDSVIISPENKEEFIEDLLKINPNIQIQI